MQKFDLLVNIGKMAFILFISIKKMTTLNGECPTCAATIALPTGTVASERLECPECHNSYVVESISAERASLIEAPAVEEDWGQ